MHFISLMSIMIALFLPCHGVAWFITWPFRSGDVTTGDEVLVRAQQAPAEEEQAKACAQKHTRPRKFEAPIRMHGKLQQVLATVHGAESACRKELAQNFVNSMPMNSCANSDVLAEYSRIATICHYHSNNRMDQLPRDCSSIHCMKAMNAEAFQVYSSFRLHVADLCREINAQLWMDAMEELITELGDVGESALVHLEKIRKESQEFMQHHDEEFTEIMDNLGSLALKQKLHIDMSEQQFNLTKKEFNYQHEHFDKLREKLINMEAAFAGFDHMVMLLLEIRENQQSYRVFEYLQVFGFYVASLLSARFVLYLADGSAGANSLRTVYATNLTLSLAFELLLPNIFAVDERNLNWTNRMIGLGATHLMAGLTVQSTLAWNSIKSFCSSRVPNKANDTPDEIMDMIHDIVALKMLVPATLLDSKWSPSPTLQNILSKPPPNYQVSPLGLREMALPVAWYKTNPLSIVTNGQSAFQDDSHACDYAHCIVAFQ